MEKMNFDFFESVIVRIPAQDESLLDTCQDEKSIFERINKLKESLLVSSPDLYDAIERYSSLSDSKKNKALKSFYKYLIRATTRPTPYGLFAGVFASPWSEKNNENNNLISQDFWSHITLDYEILNLISEKFDDLHTDDTRFYLNDTFSIKNGKLKLIGFNNNSKLREYIFQEFNLDEILENIIEMFLETKSILKKDIIKKLMKLGASKDEAYAYFLDLKQANILISEYNLYYNNKSFLDFLCRRKNLSDSRLPDTIRAINNKLEFISKNGINKTSLNQIKNMILEVIPKIDVKDYLKIDLIGLKQENVPYVPSTLKNSIKQGVDLFLKLKLYNTNPHPNINNFISEFVNKYQYQAIPLLEALDPNNGINYLSEIDVDTDDLIKDLPFYIEKQDFNHYINPELLFLYEKIKGENFSTEEVIIEEKELPNDITDVDISETLNVMFKVIDSKKKSIYIEAIGNSASKPLSRFKYADKSIEVLYKNILEYENNLILEQKKIIGEIVHFPDKIRAANLIDNFDLNRYSIPIIYSSLAISKEILLNDIYITIRNHKIILFSNSQKKEIIPRFTNMTIPSAISDFPIFRFLGDLCQNESKSFIFSWRNVPYAIGQQYFPRLRYKNIILSPRMWNIHHQEISEIINSSDIVKSMDFFRINKNLPEKILIKEYDNELVLNLTKKLDIEIFCEECVKQKKITVAEYMYNDNNLFSNNKGTPINSQIIACLKRVDKKQTPSKLENIYIEEKLALQRNFLPGDEWIYYKIYCSTSNADKILKDIYDYIILPLESSNLISKWFFIRYIDDGYNIRLRLLSRNKEEIPEVFSLINKKIPSISSIDKISIETYSREIERYGEKRMIKSEEIFHLDSKYTIKLLSTLQDYGNENLKWIYALKSIDSFLDLFTKDIEAKLNILIPVKDEFNREFNVNKEMLKSINKKYRDFKTDIFYFLSSSQSDEITFALKERNSEIESIITALNLNSNQSDLTTFIQSHIHMSLNRYFNSKQRNIEMVIYNILCKYYKNIKY